MIEIWKHLSVFWFVNNNKENSVDKWELFFTSNYNVREYLLLIIQIKLFRRTSYQSPILYVNLLWRFCLENEKKKSKREQSCVAIVNQNLENIICLPPVECNIPRNKKEKH